MREPVYEFTPETSDTPRLSPSQRKWLIGILVPVVSVAAWWGIGVLERKRTELLQREKFQLEVDFFENVIVADAQTPAFTDEDIVSLTQYHHLQLLDLAETDSGSLRELSKFKDLRVLDLRNCSWVDDEQLTWIGGLKELKRLDLSGTKVTDAGLLAIRGVPQLSQLRMVRCPAVSDGGLEILASMDQLRKVWLGKGGYRYEGLLAFRRRRPDVNLQIQPADLFWPEAGRSGTVRTLVSHLKVSEVRGFGHRIDARLDTAADVDALKKLLRFPQNWRVVQSPDQTPLRTVHDSYESNFREHIEESWEFLELSGPLACPSLAEVFPLTPKLRDVTFRKTPLNADDFPYDLAPPAFRRLHVEHCALSQEFLQRLREQTAVDQIEILAARIGGVDIHFARLGHFTTSLQFGGVAGGDQTDIEAAKWTTLELTGENAAPALGKLLPLVPDVAVVELHHPSLTGNAFPFDKLPPQLHRLHISNAIVNDSFFRELGKHVAVKHLVLHRVTVTDADLANFALGSLSLLESLQLNAVGINGVDFLDPAFEQLRNQLSERLPRTWTVIYSHSGQGTVEWGDPPPGWMVHPTTGQPIRIPRPE